eukprot:Phypoly_transcript_19397.p1 GENE.Phypoly_transcript_19397~~Phypoly_transcript_19397.p1  ORF type:complete len:205 (+),score=32.55 Phypoly_transcript_19397:36-617(+)
MNLGYDTTFWDMVDADPPLQGLSPSSPPSPQSISPPTSPQMNTFQTHHKFSHSELAMDRVKELAMDRVKELAMAIQVSTQNIQGVHTFITTWGEPNFYSMLSYVSEEDRNVCSSASILVGLRTSNEQSSSLAGAVCWNIMSGAHNSQLMARLFFSFYSNTELFSIIAIGKPNTNSRLLHKKHYDSEELLEFTI